MAYTTLNKSSSFMNPKLYTGDGGTQSVTGVGFQPDWTWIKNRGSTDSHNVYDSVRGVTKYLLTNNSVAEGTTSGVTAFNSDGFSVGNNSMTNSNSNNYASWNWKAGTAVSGNTSGSGTYKTYTGSVNTTSGFSIIKYTGNGTAGHTIPHHLGVAPSMIITKIISGDTSSWYMYHKSLGNTGNIFLDTTAAVSNSGAWWNSTTPTSSVFTVGDQTGNNSNNNPFIAYCFADVQGYSKFGSYVGNGSTDGTFVYTGFKPAFVIIKNTGASLNWLLKDNKRPSDQNLNNTNFYPNLDAAEETSNDTDFLSNGFKARNTGSYQNASGNNYMYIAFGQTLVGTNNIPNNAQ